MRLFNIVLFIGFCLLFDQAHANTYSCPTADFVFVQSNVNLAANGDTVTMPVGSVAWSNTLMIVKNITLIGSGIGTRITNHIPPFGAGSQYDTIISNVCQSNLFEPRLSGFTIVTNDLYNSASILQGEIQMVGTNSGFRIDHIKNEFCGDRFIQVKEMAYGVIDNCDFRSFKKTQILIWNNNPVYDSQTGAGAGDWSWQTPDTFGTTNAVVIENCIFTNSNLAADGGVTDVYEGGRFVFRYNSISNDSVQTHGTESGQGYRGLRAYEIYGNVFNHAKIGNDTTAILIRSGTGVIQSNTAAGYNHMATLVNYRNAYDFIVWGGADGTNSWDSNNPALLQSGTQTSVLSSLILTDNTKSWTVNQWVGFQVINIDGKGTGALHSEIDANTATTLTLEASGGFGTNIAFNIGDRYKIYQVIAAVDTTGTGMSSNMNRNIPTYPQNQFDPVYGKSNVLNGSLVGFYSKTSLVLPTTNYVDNADRPGYTPLVYPHPLDQPAFFTNLVLSFSPNPAYYGQAVTENVVVQTNGVTDTTTGTFDVHTTTNNVSAITVVAGMSAGSFSYPFKAIIGNPSQIPTATYNTYAYLGAGTPQYNGLTSNIVPLQVLLWPVTNNIISSANPSSFGANVILTYTLYTNGVVPTDATGTMVIKSDGTTLVSGSPSSGAISVTTSALAVGIHAITGTYSGDVKYTSSSYSGLNQTVNASGGTINTVTTITSDHNPSVSPQQVTFSSTITTNGILASDATGSITYIVNGVNSDTVPVIAGMASWATTTLPVVNDTVKAVYTANPVYIGSSSINYMQVNFNGPTKVLAPALIGFTNAYWIGPSATGLFAANGFRGFQNQPLDGSTAANTVANLNAIPMNSDVHLTAGVIPIFGSESWMLKSNIHIYGAGMFSTILQFPTALVANSTITNSIMVRLENNASNTVVSDLMLDCNYQAANKDCYLRGWTSLGNSNKLINVCLNNAASYHVSYQECFGINVFGYPTVPSANYNLISGCIITNFTCNSNNNMSAFNSVGGIGTRIVNCDAWQIGVSNIVFGFNISDDGVMVDGCSGHGLAAFSYTDSVIGGTNDTFQNCTVDDCSQFLDFRSGTYYNLNVLNNAGRINRTQPSDDGTCFIFQPVGGITGATFSGNSIDSTANNNGVFAAHNMTNTVVQNNTLFATVPTTLETNFVTSGVVTYSGNVNFAALPWP